MKRSETTTLVSCDACGREMKPKQLLGAESPGLWRSVRVEVSRLDGHSEHHQTVDLCGACVDRVVVPGVRAEAVA